MRQVYNRGIPIRLDNLKYLIICTHTLYANLTHTHIYTHTLDLTVGEWWLAVVAILIELGVTGVLEWVWNGHCTTMYHACTQPN